MPPASYLSTFTVLHVCINERNVGLHSLFLVLLISKKLRLAFVARICICNFLKLILTITLLSTNNLAWSYFSVLFGTFIFLG